MGSLEWSWVWIISSRWLIGIPKCFNDSNTAAGPKGQNSVLELIKNMHPLERHLVDHTFNILCYCVIVLLCYFKLGQNKCSSQQHLHEWKTILKHIFWHILNIWSETIDHKRSSSFKSRPSPWCPACLQPLTWWDKYEIKFSWIIAAWTKWVFSSI